MIKTYEEFAEFVRRSGAQATITYTWMMKGCPLCGCKRWEVTSDGWAYCMKCNKGFPTDKIYAISYLDVLDFTDIKEDNPVEKLYDLIDNLINCVYDEYESFGDDYEVWKEAQKALDEATEKLINYYKKRSK